VTATVCAECGEAWAYDRVRCPHCGSRDFTPRALGDGVLLATTVSRVTPPGVRDPNYLGIARFGDVRVTAQLADDGLEPGDEVVLAGDYELREGRRGPRLEPA
jgi:uncharacterized OB-fold protein